MFGAFAAKSECARPIAFPLIALDPLDRCVAMDAITNVHLTIGTPHFATIRGVWQHEAAN